MRFQCNPDRLNEVVAVACASLRGVEQASFPVKPCFVSNELEFHFKVG